jgi:phage repressor protein C with HTH and peptisase S24 domain
VAKCLAATGVTLDQFVALMGAAPRGAVRTVPMIGFAEASEGGHFDERGFPAGDGWDELGFAAVDDRHAYALEVSGDVLRPAFRDGTFIVVSPAAAIRRGDRVVVKTADNEVTVSELKRRTARTIELRAINPPHFERTLPVREALWMARIIWASQ